jgi:hypothetical protein
MKRHLSEKQFSDWLLGERGPEASRHVETCHPCRTELAAIEGSIAGFRSLVHESPFPAHRVSAHRVSSGRSYRPLRWALAGFAAALMVTVPVYKESGRPVPRTPVENADADAMLLKQVDAEISRAVPATMEPLVKLVAWGTGPGDGKNNR